MFDNFTLFQIVIVALVVIKTIWIVCAIISRKYSDDGGPVSGWGTRDD